MDRPILKEDVGFISANYIRFLADLEEYCDILEECIRTDNIGMEQERSAYQNRIDELEKQLHESYQGHLLEVVIPSLENRIKELEDESIEKNDELIFKNERIMELHKALEKACNELLNATCSPMFVNCELNYDSCSTCKDKINTIEKWKEWCMQDED